MSKKPKQTVPDKFEPGFLSRLDGRTEIAQRLRDSFTAIAADLGGESELSHVKASLVERFVFLEAVLAKIEHDLAAKPGEPPDLGKWIQAVNSLTGIAKTLGIERKIKASTWRSLAPSTEPTDSSIQSKQEDSDVEQS